ncbi:hypothetical protein AWN90_19245 [Nocardia terpenica]|uniref:Uncharacterized protein n=1 Tax=Nocardia terpenica TaxID=455432 RepID=A0A161WQC8_9NOCA|nr:hypothetical protein AWN90_19245 [Nocardia terpenica]
MCTESILFQTLVQCIIDRGGALTGNFPSILGLVIEQGANIVDLDRWQHRIADDADCELPAREVGTDYQISGIVLDRFDLYCIIDQMSAYT